MIGVSSIAYLIGCVLLPYTCEHAPRKLMFVFAMIGFGLSMFLMGPSEWLKLPGDNMWIIASAFPILGICQVFVFIPIIPEMYERIQTDLNIAEGADPEAEAALNDKVNDSYGLIYALSNFLSPIIGSAMNNAFSTDTPEGKPSSN